MARSKDGMQTDIQKQLEQIKEAWDNITTIPDDLTTLGFAGLTKQSVSDSFGGMSEIAEKLAENQNFKPVATSKATLLHVISNIRTHVTVTIPPNPQAHLPGLLTYIEQARVTLSSWLNEANSDTSVIPELSLKLGEIISRIKDAEKLYKSIDSGFELAKISIQQINEFAETAQAAKEAGEAKLAHLIESHSQVQKVSLEIDGNAGKISELVKDFANLTTELNDNKNTQIGLFNEFESQRDKVSDLLGDANRTGMAASFIQRRDQYNKPLEQWLRLFVGSMVVLILMAIWVITPLFSNGEWQDLLTRLPLAAPAIWLGWFSAKQYGYNAILMEDYTYKAAAAMAFEGYKRESKDLGQNSETEMQKKLLETAIKHLEENPIRIFNTQNNHASPAHEFFERSLKDEKLIDLLKAALKKFTST